MRVSALLVTMAFMVSACGQAAAPVVTTSFPPLPTLAPSPSLAPTEVVAASPSAVPVGPPSESPAPSNAASQAPETPAPTLPPASDQPRPTPVPTIAPTPTPAPTATPEPTAVAPSVTVAPTPTPVPSPTATPIRSAREVWTGDGPNDEELVILSHIPDGLFTTCRGQIVGWLKQTAAINCFDGTTGVSYVSFDSEDDMQAAYEAQVAGLNPQPTGTECGGGEPYEGGYSIGGVHTGRWYCVEALDQGISWHEMQWTHERLHMIAFAATHLLDWPAFIEFTDNASPDE